jgi:putative spermidine/putrescine transport system substrate-binding protein
MLVMSRTHPVAGTAAALALALVAGCSSSVPARSTSPSRQARSVASRTVPWAKAHSAAAGGGMSALIAAARQEGTLNLVGVPPYWANYAKIIKDFEARYRIAVHDLAPNAGSGQEITQIERYNGTSRAADVLDLQLPVAQANTRLFAAYQVSTWTAIPVSQKQPAGLWVADYGGFMSVGYNATRFGPVTSLRQLLGPKFRGAVALPGDPRTSSAALAGVMMANLALGGSPGGVVAGVSFFRDLKRAGNFNPAIATVVSVATGTTPVVFNWDDLNTAAVLNKAGWKVFIPPGAAVGGFFAQAINARAPHPAAARLWEEFLYSQAPAGGQNLWLKGGVHPVEQAAMAADGTLDRSAADALPRVPGPAAVVTAALAAAARRYVDAKWAAAVG